jgi:hypothetical protein
MSSWTSEQISFLRGAVTLPSNERYSQYCDQFGVGNRTYDAVERQVRRLKAAMQAEAAIEQVLEEDTDDSVPTTTQIDESKLRLALGRAPLVPIASQQDRLEFNEFIDSLITESLKVKAPNMPHLSTGSSLCVLLSDTHIGKLTDNFNRGVFENRIASITTKIQSEVKLPDDLEEIILMLAGDMLEGEDIYQTQAHHIEMPAIDQVQIAVDCIWKLMNSLAAAFPKVRVRVETCPGNHGRVSKMASEKTNWDNIIYQTLGYLATVAMNPRLFVNPCFESFQTFKVQDKTGMLFHHGTKHLGTASMQQKVSGWLYTKQFDFMCHGHWHHWSVDTQFGKLVMKNGSLPGDDDLSERMGVFDPPRQGWLLVRKGQPINQVGFFEW